MGLLACLAGVMVLVVLVYRLLDKQYIIVVSFEQDRLYPGTIPFLSAMLSFWKALNDFHARYLLLDDIAISE